MPIPAKFLQTILVTGADRITFLQGQLSCNMINVEGSIQLATMCNPKGRVITIFHVICATEAVYLVTRSNNIETTSAYLKRFVFRSKVQITHQHSINIFLSDTTISEDSTLLPGNIKELNKDKLRARLKNPSSIELTLITNSIVDEKGDRKTKETLLQVESFWSYQMHISGIPELTLEKSGQYLPEPLNLDLSGGINFEKGCYIGQEVIARMHYLGKAKKRLFQFISNESIAVKAGTPVCDEQGDTVGEIFSIIEASESTKMYTKINSASELTTWQISLRKAKVIGLAILTNQSTDSKDKQEARSYWIKEIANKSNSVCIKVIFPKY